MTQATNGFLAWKDLKQEHLDKLNVVTGFKKKRALLTDYLVLDERYTLEGDGAAVTRNQTRREVYLDLVLACLTFAKQNGWSPLKTSTFYSIVQHTHQECCEVPIGPACSEDKARELVAALLQRHSTQRPPYSMAIFSHNDVVNATDYLNKTYIRHLRMYQFVFGRTQHFFLSATNNTALSVTASLHHLSKGNPAAQVASIDHLPNTTTTTTTTTDTDTDITEAENSTVTEPIPESTEGGGVVEEVAVAPTVPGMEKYEQALNSELSKIQAEMNRRLKEQQEAFDKKVAELTPGDT